MPAALRPGWTSLIACVINRGTPQEGDRTQTLRMIYTERPGYRDDPVFWSRFQERVLDLYDQKQLSADEQHVKELQTAGFRLSDLRHEPLPAGFCRGVPMHLVELDVPNSWLPSPYYLHDINHSLLPAQIEPQSGVIELLPYHNRDVEKRHEQRVRLVSQVGVQVRAVRVQANGELYQAGSMDHPALVVVSFDPNIPNKDRFLHDLAMRLYDLKQRRAKNTAEEIAQEIVLDNEGRGVYHRRRQLPPAFTGGPIVYGCDLWIHRPYLSQGRLISEQRFLPCVAEPGSTGGIELLPDLEVEAAE